MTMTIGLLCHMVILLMEIINWKYGVVTYTICIPENWNIKQNKKEMKKLQQYEDFQDFVSICREEYAKRNPSITIPELKLKRRMSSHRVEHKKVQEKYLFKISANRIR